MKEKAELNWGGVCYIVMLLVSIGMVALSAYAQNSDGMVISIPVLILSLMMVFRSNKAYKLSADICLILIFMMVLAYVSDLYFDDYSAWFAIPDLIYGIVLAILGTSIVKSMLRNAPELNKGRPFVIAFTGFCISATLCEILKLTSLGLDFVWFDGYQVDIENCVKSVAMTIVGCIFSCLLYYINKIYGILGDRFDRISAVALDENDEEARRNSILELIAEGESSTLEFKSTIRINLATGEKDPRMEKAVLKTIVAFLNTRGGTLLIGVTDAGEPVGADVDSFENRDKMLLHLNHLIEDKIGREYVAYINYYIVDFEGKPVIRVDCRTSSIPVFLLDGKEPIFFVRSGPSSIDLHGMDLINYANHNFGRFLKRSSITSGESDD